MTRFNQLPKHLQDKVDTRKQEGENNKLVIPGQFPTMNTIIDKSKTHWSKYKRMKDNYDAIVQYYVEQQRIKFFEAVKLNITYYRKDKRTDPDNIAAAKKFIIDGLVSAGVLEDDGWKQVKGFKESWEVDKDNPRIEIELEEP